MTLKLQQAWPLPTQPRPIVIIGCGGIVNDAHLPAYKKASFPVLGLYDRDHSRAQQTGDKWGIKPIYSNLDEAVSAANAHNAVYDLALPPANHIEVLQKLPLGATVLLQKPMGEDLIGAKAIVHACKERQLLAAVNHQLRYAPYMLAVRDAYKQGLLGQMTDVEMHMNVADPWQLFPFLEKMERVEIQVHSIHYLDLIRSLLGEPIGVYALTIPDARFPKLKSTRSSIILNYGPETRVCLSINHNYAFGEHNQSATFKFEGDKGVVFVRIGVMLDYPKGQPDLFEIRSAGTDWQSFPLEGTWFPDAFIGPMANLQRYAAGEDKYLNTRVEDVLHTMRLVEAAYVSSASGGTLLKDYQR